MQPGCHHGPDHWSVYCKTEDRGFEERGGGCLRRCSTPYWQEMVLFVRLLLPEFLRLSFLSPTVGVLHHAPRMRRVFRIRLKRNTFFFCVEFVEVSFCMVWFWVPGKFLETILILKLHRWINLKFEGWKTKPGSFQRPSLAIPNPTGLSRTFTSLTLHRVSVVRPARNRHSCFNQSSFEKEGKGQKVTRVSNDQVWLWK